MQAVLSRSTKRNKIKPLEDNGGIRDGLIIYRRIARLSKPRYLTIGLRFTGESLEAIETASCLTSGLSSSIITSEANEFSFLDKCRMISKKKPERGAKQKNIWFTMNYHVAEAIMHSLALEKETFLGSSFAFTSYKYLAMFYFEHRDESNRVEHARRGVKEHIVNKAFSEIERIYASVDSFDANYISASLQRFELTSSPVELTRMYQQMKALAKHKSAFAKMFYDLQAILYRGGPSKPKASAARQRILVSDESEKEQSAPVLSPQKPSSLLAGAKQIAGLVKAFSPAVKPKKKIQKTHSSLQRSRVLDRQVNEVQSAAPVKSPEPAEDSRGSVEKQVRSRKSEESLQRLPKFRDCIC